MKPIFFALLLIFSGCLGAQSPGEKPLVFYFDSQVVSGNVLVIAGDPGALNQISGFQVQFYDAQGTLLTRAQSFVYPWDEGQGVPTALLPMSCTWEPGNYTIEILSTQGKSLVKKPLAITKRPYESMDIPLSPSLTNLITQPDPQKVKEAQDLNAIYWTFTPQSVFDGGTFLHPVEKKIIESAFYGDRRRYIYPNKTSSSAYHWGLDLAAPRGTPVIACGSGRIVLARKMIVTGNTVVIEHLPGVFTTYMHLNEIYLSEGSLVSAGDQVGEIGTTGLSTGPHLHWEIRVNTTPVEPKTWLKGPILDKSVLKAIMALTPEKGR